MRRTMRNAASMPLATGLLCLVLIAGQGTAGARPGDGDAVSAVRRNLNTSKMGGNQAEAAIAINPTNPANIVVTSNLEVGSGLFRGYSFDGGRTWRSGVIANGGELGHACCDPTMSWDEFGNLFLAYLSDDDFSIVPVALSTDGGVTFELLENVGAPMPLRSNGASSRRGLQGGFVDQPTITAAEGAVWVVFNQGSMVAAGAAVTGFGEVGSFGNPQTAPNTSGCSFGDISIGPNGRVFQVCQNPTSGQGPATIYGNLDADGLGGSGFGPRITITTTNVGGFDFIPAQSGRSVDAEAGLAWDRTGGDHNGRLYLVYTSEQPAESNDLNIEVRLSDNNGSTWTSPVRVNDDPTTRSQFNPRIALDQATGRIAVSFHDARLDDGSGGNGDTNGIVNDDANFFISFSTNNGASFRPNIRVSLGTSNDNQANNGVDYGDYTGLSFVAGRAYPAWADNSNSTGDNPDGTLNEFDVYTARVRVDS
jgi:hypothetical protein